MNEELKKIVSTAIATGTIVSSVVYGTAKPNCDFIVVNEGNEICVSQEVKEVLEKELGVSQGFGGVRFNPK